MEFVKVGKNYMIKNSNGRIVSEKEKLELENKEVFKNDVGCNCPDKIKKLSKNNKKIKEIEKEEKKIEKYATDELKKELDEFIKKETALEEEVQDDTIEETDKSI